MGIIADLKTRLADVQGIETLTLTMIGGRQVFGFAGLIAAVDPLATDQEIENAIRNAARLPSVALIPDKPQEVKPMSVTGAKYAGMSLKSRMAAVKTKIEAGTAKVEANFDKLDQAGDALHALGDSVGAEAEDLLATVGQFTNGGEV